MHWRASETREAQIPRSRKNFDKAPSKTLIVGLERIALVACVGAHGAVEVVEGHGSGLTDHGRFAQERGM